MKYWIDFSGYVCVEAESTEDAKDKFWQKFVANVSKPFSDDSWYIDGIEERTDGLLSTVYGNGDWGAGDVTLDGIAASCIYKPTQQELEDFWNDK